MVKNRIKLVRKSVYGVTSVLQTVLPVYVYILVWAVDMIVCSPASCAMIDWIQVEGRWVFSPS